MPSTVSSTKPTTGVDDSDSIPIKFTVGPDSLPIEIYGEIFGWLLASNNPNAINVTGLVLRQVSKLLEKAVLSYPEFWTQICLNCTVIPSGQLHGIKGLIVSKGPCARNGGFTDFIQAQAFLNHKAAMYITSYARLSGTMPLELSLKLPFRVNSTELDVLFILEQSIIKRVQYLVLELSVSAACHLASRISSTEGNKVWSQLEKLKLVIHGSNPDPTFRTYVNSGTAGGRSLMPRLTNLRLEIYRFPNSEDLNGTSFLALGFPLSQLTCLDLVSLGHKQFYTCIPMAHACRDNLEILRLNFCRQSQLESHIAMDENSELHRILRESPGIIFPKLKVLDLGVWHEEHSMSRRGSGLDRDLSRVFILPSLEDLTIVYRGLNHSKERLRTQIQQGKMKVSTLLSLVSQCGDGLRNLWLSNISFEGDSDDLWHDPYTHILSQNAFKNLERLIIADDFLPSFGFLTGKIDDCNFLPNLRWLQLAPGSHLPERMKNVTVALGELKVFHKRRAPSPKDSHLKLFSRCATLERCSLFTDSFYYFDQLGDPLHSFEVARASAVQ